jgi:hypothetical protein
MLTKQTNGIVNGSTQADHSLGFRNSCLATENVADGPTPMTNGSPHRKRPNLISPDYAGAQLPCTKLAFGPEKTRNNLIHLRSPRGVVLDHIVDKWLHKLKPVIFLSQSKVRTVPRSQTYTDLDIISPNQAPEIVNVCRKRITPRLAVLVFGRGFVTSLQRFVERWSIGGIIIAGKTEIDEKISRWPSAPRIRLRLVPKISTSVYLDGVKRFWIHV